MSTYLVAKLDKAKCNNIYKYIMIMIGIQQHIPMLGL
jgi:hypothetical protein